MLFIAREKNKNVELVWIPSHRNIYGNDKADELAKKAARKDPILEKNSRTLILLPYLRRNVLKKMKTPW